MPPSPRRSRRRYGPIVPGSRSVAGIAESRVRNENAVGEEGGGCRSITDHGPAGRPRAEAVLVTIGAMSEQDDTPSLDMVTAALRADSTDVAIYARVLTKSLGEALPPEFVTVDRDRSVSDRMRGRPGEISRIAVQLGDQQMTLSVQGGQAVAEVCRAVRGVVLSRQTIPIHE